MSKLIVLQKKIIRTIADVPYNEHSEPLFKKMNMLQLYINRYRLHTSKYVLSFLHNVIPRPLNDLFTTSKDTHDHTTRHCSTMKLQTFKSRTNVASNGMGPQVWNDLPKSLNTSILNAHQTLITIPGFSAHFQRVTIREYSNE